MKNNLSIDDFALNSALRDESVKDKQCILIYCADCVIHLLQKYIDENKKYYLTFISRKIKEKAEKIFENYENVNLEETEYFGKSIKKDVSYILDLSNQGNWSKNGLEDIGYKIDEVDLIHVITHGSLVCNTNDMKAREYFLNEAHVDKVIEITNKEHIIKRTKKTYLVSIESKNMYKKGKVPTKTEFVNYTNSNGGYKFLRKCEMENRTLLNFKNWNPEVILNRNNDEIFEFIDNDIDKLPIRKIKYILCKGTSIVHPYSRKGNIAVINKNNIKNNNLEYKNLKKIKCENEKYYQNHMLKKGDILLYSDEAADNIVIFEGEDSTTIVDSQVFYIRVKENINPYYVKVFLNSELGKKYLKELKKANMVKILNQKILENILIPIIPKEEQDKIVKECLVYNNNSKSLDLKGTNMDLIFKNNTLKVQG